MHSIGLFDEGIFQIVDILDALSSDLERLALFMPIKDTSCTQTEDAVFQIADSAGLERLSAGEFRHPLTTTKLPTQTKRQSVFICLRK